ERQYVPGMLNEYGVFGGGKRKVNTMDFRGGHVDAVFGGFEIDLRDAIMEGDAATLETNAVFGGIEVRIPITWSAVVQGVGVFGAFQDETTQPNPTLIPNPKRLIVKGGAVFGAVEVKN
ncbi:MAG TPA: LiaF domain-containing protein, partial [Candidatus Sulfopaludibacter sp.]|nr:LiaF domain-containing protein [Candidatus Sulfopaludibacter sp.]